MIRSEQKANGGLARGTECW